MENIYLEESQIEIEDNIIIEEYIIDEENFIKITFQELSLFPLCP